MATALTAAPLVEDVLSERTDSVVVDAGIVEDRQDSSSDGSNSLDTSTEAPPDEEEEDDMLSLAKSSGDEEDKTVSLEESEDEETQIDLDTINRPPLSEEEQQKQDQVLAKSMELNDAFMALENMRKANLEVEFGGKAIPNVQLFHQYCSTCLHEQKKRREEFLRTTEERQRRKMLVGVVNRIKARRRHPLCLVCTSPVCAKHACKAFKKEKITVCGKCAPLFTMDYVVETFSHDDEARRQAGMAHMIDSYDRALLMLRYSSQFIDEIADTLEHTSKKNDHIGLGSSMIGLTSGFTGVASIAVQFVAAAAILSPAGPPLLMASILFGASAAAASTGTEAFTYYSQPNQLANKILALHDLVQSLLGVTTVLRDCIAKGHVDAKHYIDMQSGKRTVAYWKSRAPKPPVVPVVTEETEVEDDETTTTTNEDAMAENDEGAATTTDEAEGAETTIVAESKDEPAIEEKPMKTASLNDIDDDDEVVVLPKKKTASLSDIDGDDDLQQEEVVVSPKKKTASLSDIDDDDEDEVEVALEKDTAVEASDVVPAAEQDATEESKETTAQTLDGDDASDDDKTMDVVVGENDSSDKKDSADASASLEGEPQVTKPTPTDLVAAPSNMRCAMSRATTNVIKLAQFASVACVMLSFTTIVLEAKNLKDTLKSLKAGSPCEKAQKLRTIKKLIDSLPETKEIVEDCNNYLEAQAK
ncbi:expressed unknown protein [Seminavis robusta]|uniref:Uncharacterized protein n=1 Tax=Seminavis robusta TaxID=568900 RepID=A0A9N8ET99_9STRA|nr:expressed unknown protein [Seminavis robusta]|eukprot:Sro1884_g303520.1 n/a (702) ;mRNA; r:17521-19626